tara:strand:- start:155 stop:1201 length:1047 start_codon:yes stop_codon:yes gene_type:complete
MIHKRCNIKNLSRQELRDWFKKNENSSRNIKSFRADQIFKWLYKKKVEKFDQMLNIGKMTRNILEDHFYISSLKVADLIRSSDGSIKYRILLDDGNSIESVFLPHDNHNTICISSQAGCAMGCDFCMTAKMGLKRNLEPSEIINQILTVFKELPEEIKIRNIVFMGMGEPFHNYKNLMQALEIITDEHGFNFSHRRITVSTSGLLPKIRSFGLEKIKANLAISLNGVTDEVRSKLMPVNKAYNLEKLIKACSEFPLESRKRITFEYILIQDMTDSLKDAKSLIRLLHGLKFKINLIPYNSTPGSKYFAPSPEKARMFQKYLLDHKIIAPLRISKGQDIQGACGQLAVG